jgi:hypothetical protein
MSLDDAVIAKLEAAVATGDFVIMPKAQAESLRLALGHPSFNEQTFSSDDLKVLTELIRFWRGATALGFVGGIAKNILWFAGWALGIYLLIKGKVPITDLWKAIAG